MYEDFSDYEEEDISIKKGIDIKYIILGILVIILFVIMYISLFGEKSYNYYEEKMVSAAKKYVKENDITTYKEVYYDNTKLNVNLPSNCANTSGVIYDGSNYVSYLVCSDYESDIVNNEVNYFKLVGEEVVILIKGETYHELGYISDEKVTIAGEVGTEEGIYNIYYILENNEMITRKIIVINNSSLLNSYPKIELVGDSIINISLGEEYFDSGVYATDQIDGNITNNVLKYEEVNTYKQGEYVVYYVVKNSRGYKNSVKRHVIVTSNQSDISVLTELSSSNITNKSVNIIFNILGTSYSHTILPNNEINDSNNFQYEVKENGSYKFQIVSMNGAIEEKEIEVKNIYQGAINGTCSAVSNDDYVKISVNASSDIEIMGYNYFVDNNSSGYKISNEYKKYGAIPSNVYVNVRDIIGNETKIKCNVSKEEKSIYANPNGITKTLSGKPRLRIPITTALANKGHTVTDLNLCIYNRVKEAGPGTRYGVIAAGVGLIECTLDLTGYVLSYNHTSGKVEIEADNINYCTYNSDICGKLGINTRWGYQGGSCNKNSSVCYHGLNCATFVRWAMCNGGMDLCSRGSAGAFSMANTKYFPEADGVIINGKSVKYYSGNDLTGYGADTLVRMIKPGDVVAMERNDDTDGSSHHVVLVVGKDDNGIYTAEDGYFMSNIKYSEMVNGVRYYRILFLDNYYANANNKNNLYK